MKDPQSLSWHNARAIVAKATLCVSDVPSRQTAVVNGWTPDAHWASEDSAFSPEPDRARLNIRCILDCAGNADADEGRERRMVLDVDIPLDRTANPNNARVRLCWSSLDGYRAKGDPEQESATGVWQPLDEVVRNGWSLAGDDGLVQADQWAAARTAMRMVQFAQQAMKDTFLHHLSCVDFSESARMLLDEEGPIMERDARWHVGACIGRTAADYYEANERDQFLRHQRDENELPTPPEVKGADLALMGMPWDGSQVELVTAHLRGSTARMERENGVQWERDVGVA